MLVNLNENTIAFTDFVDNVVVLSKEAITSMVIDKKGRVNIFTIDQRHFMLLKNQYKEELDVLNAFLTDNIDFVDSENGDSLYTQSFAFVIYDEDSYKPLYVFNDEKQCISFFEEIEKRAMSNRKLNWKAINLEFVLRDILKGMRGNEKE